ncbi:MAG: metal-dependent hydrolase [Planctomycetota bacterium]|nr:metal-dependent hydrolase [Planctomycetota bacterium]MDA1179016.1 metal-dependent hydrolase [Planctomycetota bacterium]
MQVTWLGHGSWLMEIGEHRLVLDPFLNDSPVAPYKSDQIRVDHILISHGHFDHTADAAEIARRCDATIVAIHEIAEWFRTTQGIERTEGMNRGGWLQLPYARIKMTVAFHSSQLPDGSYGGEAAGYVVEADGKRVYFACDTALFSDMRLIGDLGIDLAVLPIGDRYTMGIDDSLEAVRYVRPAKVAPSHYNTWPPIAQDVERWSRRVVAETQAMPQVLQPGESFTL